MAGAKLNFDNGWMGIERCQDKRGTAQFLMAHIYSKSKRLRTSSPISTAETLEFAIQTIKQTLLAEGWTGTEINNVVYAAVLAQQAITKVSVTTESNHVTRSVA